MGSTARHPRRAPIQIIHNAGVVCAVHAPHSVGACLVLCTADLDASLPLMARERATHVLLGHGHFRAVAHPGSRPRRRR